MNWKRLFFISTVFWIGAFGLTNCSSNYMKFAQSMIEDTDVADCKKFPEKCNAIQRQIDAYENVLSASNTEISLFGRPIEGDSMDENSIIVNGKDVSYNEIESEEEILRGYRYKAKELHAISTYALSKKGDGYVYTMFAINPKAKGRSKSKIKKLDMYFQAKSKKGKVAFFDHGGKDINFTLGELADFPKPCPHFCPDTIIQNY